MEEEMVELQVPAHQSLSAHSVEVVELKGLGVALAVEVVEVALAVVVAVGVHSLEYPSCPSTLGRNLLLVFRRL